MRKQYVLFFFVFSLAVFTSCIPLQWIQDPEVEEEMIVEEKEKKSQEIIYSVGQKGPAGGFIFYDKGFYSDGWRYLEIAPYEGEFTWSTWSPTSVLVEGTSREIGTGLENTKVLVEKIEGSHPAKMCDDLVYNGFSDWFLPSIDELVLLYPLFFTQDVGDFLERDGRSHEYWSSSESKACCAWYFIGSNGGVSDGNKQMKALIRAARRF